MSELTHSGPAAAPIFRVLAHRYGDAYNRGQDVGFESGYAGPGHWSNLARWRDSAEGLIAAAREIADLPGSGAPGRPAFLDVGCGRGVMVEQLREQGAEAWGIDLGADGIRSRWCVGANAVALPFAEPFQVVVALDVVEHVPADLQGPLLAELARACAGLLLVTVPTSEPWFRFDSRIGPRNHYLCMHPAEWRAHFERHGFEARAGAEVLTRYGPPFSWGPDNYPFALAPCSRRAA